MLLFVVTEFLPGFHKTIWGTTRSVKICFFYFNKSLLRCSGCKGLREYNKRLNNELYYGKKFLVLFFQCALKAHRQISKKRCFGKYCLCDQACQFSALRRKNYLYVITRLRKSCLIFKKIQKQSPEVFYRKRCF